MADEKRPGAAPPVPFKEHVISVALAVALVVLSPLFALLDLVRWLRYRWVLATCDRIGNRRGSELSVADGELRVGRVAWPISEIARVDSWRVYSGEMAAAADETYLIRIVPETGRPACAHVETYWGAELLPLETAGLLRERHPLSLFHQSLVLLCLAPGHLLWAIVLSVLLG